MRSLRVPVSGLPARPEGAEERVLDDGTSHYVARVLRLPVGEVITLFDAKLGTVARAEVLEVGAQVKVRIGVVEQQRDRGPFVQLLYALAKGDKVDSVIQDATELRASHITLVSTERSVVQLSAERATARHTRWERIAEQAARQCGRAQVPVIDGPMPLAEAAQQTHALHKFCLHPAAPVPLGNLLPSALGTGDGLAFAIGPEGGFSSDELSLLERTGFTLVRIGDTVLRTETVAACVLGAVLTLHP